MVDACIVIAVLFSGLHASEHTCHTPSVPRCINHAVQNVHVRQDGDVAGRLCYVPAAAEHTAAAAPPHAGPAPAIDSGSPLSH